MKAILLILFFTANGEVRTEQVPMADMATCHAAAQTVRGEFLSASANLGKMNVMAACVENAK